MNFEHLIQINDPTNPLVQGMTRDQLWEGLVLRAEQPQLFVLGLDSCTIVSRTDTTLERELHFGHATVRDLVTLQPKESVRYDIMATSAHVGGSLTMTIEQPDALQLFLRFEYRTTLPTADNSSPDSDVRQTQEIVKSAYRESDIDTVRLIRQYVLGANPSDQPLH
ncbi:MAG TPA: SRPBCC family protein [Paraburkholderia sp.]|nr:SRPBCC family protein [Paraburkholderia sp.]